MHFPGGQIHGDQVGAGKTGVFADGHVVFIQRGGQQIGGGILRLFSKNQQCAVFPVAGDCAAVGIGHFNALHERH